MDVRCTRVMVFNYQEQNQYQTLGKLQLVLIFCGGMIHSKVYFLVHRNSKSHRMGLYLVDLSMPNPFFIMHNVLMWLTSWIAKIMRSNNLTIMICILNLRIYIVKANISEIECRKFAV